MRYTHTNLDAKRNATQKLEAFNDNLILVGGYSLRVLLAVVVEAMASTESTKLPSSTTPIRAWRVQGSPR
jgi:hypothetical protein